MNDDVYRGAIKAGCTQREAEVLATYVESETIEDAADRLGITSRTVTLRLGAARRRLRAAHTPALVAIVIGQGADSGNVVAGPRNRRLRID